MEFTEEQRKRLMEDIPDEAKKVLSQDAGQKAGLEYIKAQYPMLLLSAVFGPDGWYPRVMYTKLLAQEHVGGKTWHVSYLSKVRVYVCARPGVQDTQMDLYKENVGSHVHKKPSRPEAHTNASMGSVSIGIKRACVMWGRALGLALYEDDADEELVDKILGEDARGPKSQLVKDLEQSILLAKDPAALQAAQMLVAQNLQALTKPQVKKLTDIFTAKQVELTANGNGVHK